MRVPKTTEEEYRTLCLKLHAGPCVSISPPVKKGNKYGAVKKTIDGYTFDSSGEAKRYMELRMLGKAGKITALSLQLRYRLSVNGVHVCDYYPDFTYYEHGVLVVEDFKGLKTPVYQLKKKLMLAIHGITIRETAAHR